MSEQIEEERIVFRPPLPASLRERLALGFFALLATWWVIQAVLDQSGLRVVYGLAGAIYLAYQLVKYCHGASADSAGLHRPLRRVLPWEQVRAIDEPSELRPELVLWCTDGKRRGTLLPITYADQLSRISRRPIETEKAMQRPLPKVEVHKTWQQEQDDFAARSARVKARNAELLGGNDTGGTADG